MARNDVIDYGENDGTDDSSEEERLRRPQPQPRDYFPPGYQFPYQTQVEPTKYETGPFASSAVPAAPAANGYNRQKFQEGWYGLPSHSPEALKAYVAANPSFASGVQVNNDKVTLPEYTEEGTGIRRGPENLDLIIDAGRRNAAGWTGFGGTGVGGAGTDRAGATGAFGDSFAGGVGTSGTGGSRLSSGVLSDPNAQAIFNLLMKRAQQGLNVSPDDPLIKAQTDAYRAEQERAGRNYLSDAAEREGATADLTPERRSIAEKVGQASSGFTAQAMQRELDARRQEIVDALKGASGFLTAQQQMQLQQELHMIDDELQRWQFSTGLGAQESQFVRNLAQRESEYGRGLGQRAYEYDTSRGDQLFG